LYKRDQGSVGHAALLFDGRIRTGRKNQRVESEYRAAARAPATAMNGIVAFALRQHVLVTIVMLLGVISWFPALLRLVPRSVPRRR
jgi:hypothetical protein